MRSFRASTSDISRTLELTSSILQLLYSLKSQDSPQQFFFAFRDFTNSKLRVSISVSPRRQRVVSPFDRKSPVAFVYAIARGKSRGKKKGGSNGGGVPWAAEFEMQIGFNMDDRGLDKIRSNTSCRQAASGELAYSASLRQAQPSALHQALVTQCHRLLTMSRTLDRCPLER